MFDRRAVFLFVKVTADDKSGSSENHKKAEQLPYRKIEPAFQNLGVGISGAAARSDDETERGIRFPKIFDEKTEKAVSDKIESGNLPFRLFETTDDEPKKKKENEEKIIKKNSQKKKKNEENDFVMTL